MPNLDHQIAQAASAFAAEIVRLVRQSILDDVSGGHAPARRAAAPAGRKAAAPAPAKAAAPAKKPAAAAASRKKGAKRDPAEIAKTTTALLAYVKGHPGQRVEEIAKGMKIVTKDLVLPARKLIATKKLKTQGQKRATKYFAA